MIKPAISVIIPTHCFHRDLELLIGDLGRQRCSQPFEVILADDAMPEADHLRVQDCLSRLGPAACRLVRLERNSGPATARNMAMQQALGEVFILIDSDCRLHDAGHLERLYARHLEHPGALIGGGIAGFGAGCVALADRFCHWSTNIPGVVQEQLRSGHLVTAHLVIPRAVWKRIGPFRDVLRTGEDTAFSLAARRAGVPIRLDGDIVLHHHDRESLSAFLRCFYVTGKYRAAVRQVAYGSSPLFLSGPVPLRWLLALPIACGLTLQHLRSWWPHDKRVLAALPLVFLGMAAMAAGVAVGLPAGALPENDPPGKGPQA